MGPVEQPEQNPGAEAVSSRVEGDSRTPQVMKGGGGNVDKIRDILFGSQMRDYEARFAHLEEALLKETTEIRETNRRRFDQLESYIKAEFEVLQTRLKGERDERSEVAGQHSRELKELAESLGRRVRDLDDRASAVDRDLRIQLLQQARDLSEEMRSRHDEIAAVLEKRFQELRHGKTDRAALATLFNEVALRLNDQFQIPDSDD